MPRIMNKRKILYIPINFLLFFSGIIIVLKNKSVPLTNDFLPYIRRVYFVAAPKNVLRWRNKHNTTTKENWEWWCEYFSLICEGIFFILMQKMIYIFLHSFGVFKIFDQKNLGHTTRFYKWILLLSVVYLYVPVRRS